MKTLPPVRKRTDYHDIRADELVFALFYDKIGQDLTDLDKAMEPTMKKAFASAPTYHGYAAISKVDEIQRIVYGVASTESPDQQPGIWKGQQYAGDIVSSQAMQDAAPGYLEFPTIREMHQPLAAGTAIHFDVQGGQTLIGAHIVDDNAWKKVQTGTYRGFSIGGRALDAEIIKVDGVSYRKITKLHLSEISLVDRPANSEAKITLFKGDDLMDAEQTATDVAEATELSKAADPSKAIALLQQLRNDAENDGDMDAADSYTQAIRQVAEAVGIATAADDDEDADASDDDMAMDDSGDDTAAPGAAVQMAAGIADIRKRYPDLGDDVLAEIAKFGASLSATNMGHAKTAHDALQKMTGGAVCEPGKGNQVAMAEGLAPQDLTKVLQPAFDGLAKGLEAIGVKLTAYDQRLDHLERQPAAGAPAARAVPVEKVLATETNGQPIIDPAQAEIEMLRKQLQSATNPDIQRYLSDEISKREFAQVFKRA